jgi:hypothetical protein
MLLICNVSLLSAQEINSNFTSFVSSSNLPVISGPASALSNEDPVATTPARKTVSLSSRRTYYRLGERVMSVNKQVTDNAAPYVFLSLHNNETSITEAARRIIFSQGGTLIELLNDNQRDITFSLFEKEVSVDPNRIFTPKGRNRDLSINSKTDNIIAHQLNGFAQFILDEIPHEKVILNVHSNEKDDFTMDDYGRNGDRDRDALMIFRSNTQNVNDFFVTTDRDIYNALKEKNYNVILQSVRCKDDGSLSVYCVKMRRMYIGIETMHGHDAQQEEMVRVATEILR